MKTYIGAALAVVSLLLPAGAFAQSDLQPAAIVKLTKTEPISVKQLKAEVSKLEAQAKRTLSQSERRQVLDVMINERLAVQAAERDKLAVAESEVNAQIQKAKDSMNAKLGRAPTDKEFEDALKAETGMTLAEYKDSMRRQMTVQKYLTTKKRDKFESVSAPTEAEIKSTYELSKAKLVRPDTVRFTMIFVPRGDNADALKKARETAEKLAAEIGSSSAKFDEVVLRAQMPNAAYQAGDGGFLPRSAEAAQVVGADFMNAAFALKVGDVSKLLENPRGFQIIKVTEMYLQKTLELNDPYQLGARGTVRDYIGNMLLQQKQQKVIEEATLELVTELRAGNPFQIFENNLAW